MANWTGFTDEDLRKMRHTTPDDEELNSRSSVKQGMARRPKPSQPRVKVGRSVPPSKVENIGRQAEKHDSVTRPSSDRGKIAKTRVESDEVTSQIDQRDSGTSDAKNQSGDMSSSGPVSHVKEEDVKELNESEALSVELGNVQKFQQQQKLIEEANKQKRILLAKAIADRKKKAKAEAEKLMKIQQELNHLDTLLTADVNIIRDKIEVASLEYMDAHKRYEKAEKEFIEAKLDLFTKGETKEHLTEHLYTIIHQNEVRKAKKLVELMEELSMEVTAEEMELTIPAIPQLSNFTAVATLHDPYHNKANLNTEKAGDGTSALVNQDATSPGNTTSPNSTTSAGDKTSPNNENSTTKTAGLSETDNPTDISQTKNVSVTETKKEIPSTSISKNPTVSTENVTTSHQQVENQLQSPNVVLPKSLPDSEESKSDSVIAHDTSNCIENQEGETKVHVDKVSQENSPESLTDNVKPTAELNPGSDKSDENGNCQGKETLPPTSTGVDNNKHTTPATTIDTISGTAPTKDPNAGRGWRLPFT